MIPAGVRELAEYLDAKRQGQAPPGSALPLEFFSEIDGTVEPDDFVEGLLGRGGASVVYGPPNCGKTFLCSDLALHVALGWTWFGRRTEAGGVLYVACEGSVGFRKRVEAARKAYGIARSHVVPFALAPVSVALRDGQADIDRVVDAAERIKGECGCPVLLIIIDTLSRAMAGGDENAASDMGQYVKAIDQIRRLTGAHVLSVHHTGKNASAGARGHSSLLGAIDTEIEISRDEGGGTSTATVTKQRDFEGGQRWKFELETVKIGTDRRGNSITSCVVRRATPERPDPLKALKPGSCPARAYQILLAMDTGAGRKGVTAADWRGRMVAEGVTSAVSGTERAQFKRILAKLRDINALSEFDGHIYPVRVTRDTA